jgi:hypothetical protein
MIEINGTIILPVSVCGCETWSVTLGLEMAEGVGE